MEYDLPFDPDDVIYFSVSYKTRTDYDNMSIDECKKIYEDLDDLYNLCFFEMRRVRKAIRKHRDNLDLK